jgi:hypothetical protein
MPPAERGQQDLPLPMNFARHGNNIASAHEQRKKLRARRTQDRNIQSQQVKEALQYKAEMAKLMQQPGERPLQSWMEGQTYVNPYMSHDHGAFTSRVFLGSPATSPVESHASNSPQELGSPPTVEWYKDMMAHLLNPDSHPHPDPKPVTVPKPNLDVLPEQEGNFSNYDFEYLDSCCLTRLQRIC